MSKDNGGAAFPTIARTVQVPLTAGNSNPTIEKKIPAQDGMTLRDYFAAQVAAGDAASDQGWGSVSDEVMLGRARIYYRIADAMLIARDEKQQPETNSDHDF